jgi:hypothetical protein
MSLYSQGTEAESGIFSDLSGGHEFEEYMSLYSQGTEAESEYSLTYLEVLTIKNI